MKNNLKIKRMVGIAILCAITFVLQYFVAGVLPKLPLGGGTAISLSLIPIVVAAILYGPIGGLSVGLFFGAVTLLPGQGAEGFYVNWYMTILAILLCLLKAGLAGFVAGLLFKIISKKNYVVAVIVAAIVAPLVNTGTFLLLYGILIYIMTGSSYGATFTAVFVAVWLQALIELAINVLIAPALATVIRKLASRTNLGFANTFDEEESEEE